MNTDQMHTQLILSPHLFFPPCAQHCALHIAGLETALPSRGAHPGFTSQRRRADPASTEQEPGRMDEMSEVEMGGLSRERAQAWGLGVITER